MEIRLARHYGYCFGVQRALDMVHSALKDGPFPVWTLGPIIHNPTAVKELTEMGAMPVSSPREVTAGTLVQRSHGTTKEEAALIPASVRALDATCPFVQRAQKKAEECAGKGMAVVLVGDKDHPETRAIMSHAGKEAVCVRDAGELRDILDWLAGREVALLAQTTSRRAEVEKTVAELKKAGISVHSSNTICTATQKRQDATMELAKECQVVLVVGGRTSANTRQLLEIARQCGAEAYLVESAKEVQAAWFVGKSRVGIAAGASTPDRVIKEVVGKVEELEKPNCEMEPEKEKGPETPSEPESQPESEETEALEVAPLDRKEEEPQPETEEVPDEVPEEAAEEAACEGPQEELQETEAMGKSAEDLYAETFKSLEEGQIVQGKVVSVDDNGALVDVGAKSEGLIPASEFQRKGAFATPPLSPGDEIMVCVQSSDPGDGILRLSKRRADEEAAWRKVEEAHEEGSIVEAPVVQEVKGGLVVDVGLRGFVPASQVERGYVNDLSKYVGNTLTMKVLELDRNKNRVVLSQRIVLEEEHERLCAETWATIAEGQVRRGVVKGITDFGVFIDLGGVDGLLHISELSWGRVKHPSEVVKEGEEIDAKVLRVDREKGKISLGRKQVLPDPWETAEAKYPVDSVLEGEVTRTAPFGAFVQLEPGVEGLVHISEIADRHITKPEEEVNAGDRVFVRVLRVRQNERRVSLSIRQADQIVLPEPEPEAEPEVEADAVLEVVHDPVPEVEPEAASDVVPDEACDAAPEQEPEVEVDAAPEVTSEAAPVVEPEVEPGVEADEVPVQEPETEPAAAPDVTPEVEPTAEPEAVPDEEGTELAKLESETAVEGTCQAEISEETPPENQ